MGEFPKGGSKYAKNVEGRTREARRRFEERKKWDFIKLEPQYVDPMAAPAALSTTIPSGPISTSTRS